MIEQSIQYTNIYITENFQKKRLLIYNQQYDDRNTNKWFEGISIPFDNWLLVSSHN